MDYNKGLSALSYLSGFFAPLIVPILILVATKDKDVRYHSKRALFSHLIPVVLGVFFAIFAFFTMFTLNDSATTDHTLFITFIVVSILYGIVAFAIAIWNLVQGIKVLQ